MQGMPHPLKDMYKNVACIIFAITKGCRPWASKMFTASSSLYSDKQGCWGKGFCLAPFCGECIALTFLETGPWGKKQNLWLALFWRMPNVLGALSKLAIGTCIGEECIGHFSWQSMCWTLLLEKNVLEDRITCRRKFISQTSDNMDRWKAEMGKSRNTVFFQWFVVPKVEK